MPSPITEFFDGGIVTSRHPSLLQPGELQRADNCVYREKDPSIQRAPGRTAYNSVALSAGVRGLIHLSFDQNIDQLVAWPQGNASTSFLYKSDFTGITGSFSVITGPGTIASCVTTNTLAVVTAPAGSFTNMVKGVKVAGVGIPVGTTILTVDSSTQITLTQNATVTGTPTLTFETGIAFPMSDLGTEILDAIQWQSSYFLLTKNNPVTRLSWKQFPGAAASSELLNIRPAGLLPVTQFTNLNVTVQAGAGWSSVLNNGYYWFLLTEILASDDPSLPDVEAGYIANEGRAIAVQITTYATQFIRITFPFIRNDGANGTNRATHWGVYMSVIAPGQAAYSDATSMPSLATFRRIAKVAIEETSKDLRFDNTTLGPSLPTVVSALGSLEQFFNSAGFLNRGTSVATGTSGGSETSANILSSFGFSSGAPYSGYSVTGIRVNIVHSSGDNKAGYYVWLDNGAGKSSWSNFGVADRNTMYSKEWGGQHETWGVAWTPTDMASLRVNIQKGYSAGTQVLKIDYIEVTVFYTGAALDTGSLNLDGPPYQVVTYRSQVGTTVNDTANYLIPWASTGDVFQGALVLNDTANPGTLRYSLANAPESFPKPYEMKFDSRKKDIITFIRRLGQILIVGMRDSIKRINYLPTESDVDFHQGRAHEDIVTDNGIAGPLAGVLFDLPGQGTVLGYASYNGFNYTDGITSRPMTLGLDMATLVKSSALSTSIFRVYPKEKWLVFYYCPFGATHSKNTRALIFHYGIDKVRSGYLAVTGPVTVSARSASEANLTGVPYFLTGHETSGVIYVEDSGNAQPTGYQVHNAADVLADAPITPVIKTRKIFPAGYHRDAREQNIYLLYSAMGTSFAASGTLTITSPNVSSSSAFTNVLAGMFVTGEGVLPGTIVKTKTDASNIILSSNAIASGLKSLTFDDGAISITMRGSGIREDVSVLNTIYHTTRVGDLLVTHHDNIKQGIELQIEKILLPTDVQADLGQQMKLQNFTYLVEDAGQELNRTV